MAHRFFLPRDNVLFQSFATVSPATGRSYSVPNVTPLKPSPPAPPPRADVHLLDDDSGMIADYAARTVRSDSMFSDDTQSSGGSKSPMRRNSALAAHRNPRVSNAANIRTHSISGPCDSGGAVTFERSYSEPSDDDLIIVTVRLSNKFRKSSLSGAEELPSRPPPRSFLRRMSTRLNMDHTAEREERYKAIKLPRREYKRHFARDHNGNYAGTEPERQWDESDLLRKYGAYQDLPLNSIIC